MIKTDLLLEKIEKIIDHKYWTNYLGLARSLLALGTLLTLIFNTNQTLMLSEDNPYSYNNVNYYNIFILFQDLLVSRILSYVILISVIIGIYPRYIAFFHWWVSISFVYASGIVEGGDQITAILTFLLLPILILDRRKNHWTLDMYKHSYYQKVIAFIFYGAIILQVSIVYFNASIGKLKVEEWKNGTAVYYWFYDSVFGLNYTLLNFVSPLLKSSVIVLLLTWGAIAVELFLSLMIFKLKITWLRKIAFVIGIILHFSFAICFGLFGFFLAMTASLLIYLRAIDNNFIINKKRWRYITQK